MPDNTQDVDALVARAQIHDPSDDGNHTPESVNEMVERYRDAISFKGAEEAFVVVLEIADLARKPVPDTQEGCDKNVGTSAHLPTTSSQEGYDWRKAHDRVQARRRCT